MVQAGQQGLPVSIRYRKGVLFMIRKVATAAVLLLMAVSIAGAQDMGSLTFIENLGNKKTATFGDAVSFYMLTLDRNTQGFNRDLNTLNAKGIAAGYNYKKGDALRKGVIALMVARHLKLKDSLWYVFFGTERYAYRACIAAGILPPRGSEWDKVSGEELIEIMRRVGERSGGTK